jgi:hypothetical protein
MQTSTAKPRSSSSSLTTAPARSERTTRQRPVELALCAAHHCAIIVRRRAPQRDEVDVRAQLGDGARRGLADRRDPQRRRQRAFARRQEHASCSTLAALVTNSHS